jgi:deoxyribose-phosphate aldolase
MAADRDGLASIIDHTLLRPDATRDDIARLCAEAVEWGFKAVCVNPVWVELASGALRGERPVVCSVAGFPLGAGRTKAAEASTAVDDGAAEIDMVMNIGLLRSGDTHGVEADIASVVESARGADVKVILETCLLTDEEKVLACRAAENGGARWVKTSTGFSAGGATVHDVRLLREAVGDRLGVKASGGIRTRDDAIAMLDAGASRLGCSRSVDIVRDRS